ncbi:nuclease-related domain-containing protein [Candidatus Altiarchaeota archaeon]
MVRILKRRDPPLYVWRNMHLNKSRAILFFTLLVLAFLLFVMDRFPFASMGLILIPISYFLGVYAYKNYLLWMGGMEGEWLVNRVLEGLDDSFILLNNIVVPPNRGDTDHIVFGPSGIFVIESKHYGGVIECEGDEWSRYKVGRAGGVYGLSIGSPSNQAKRNAKVLKDLLLSHQYEAFPKGAPHLWVNAILVFTNSNVKLNLRDERVPVVSADDLVGYISSFDSERRFTASEVDLMGDLVLKHST